MRYYWWKVSDLMDLLTMIMQEGADNLQLRFDPKTKMFELIDTRSGNPCGSYNETHTCPPDCF